MSNENANGQDQRSLELRILGQEFIVAANVWGALMVLFICAALAIPIYYVSVIAHDLAKNPRLQRQILQMVASYLPASTLGSQDLVDSGTGQRLLRFWTPSAKTKDAYREGEDVPNWYFVDDDEKLIDKFADELASKEPQGYRRYEVFGRGQTEPKWGYFWEVTADLDNDEFKRPAFINFYHRFWGRQMEAIYLEEFPVKNTYETP